MRLLLFTLMLFTVAVNAEPLDVATDTFELGNHAFPVKVVRVGQEITSGSIANSYTFLEGADLTGWYYGLNNTVTFKLIFQHPIEDFGGDDLYIGQGRMAEYDPPIDPRHALEFSLDGETWHYLSPDDFEMASTYWYLPRTTVNWYYQLHKSTIDFALYGVTAPVTEVYIRGVEFANLVVVGNMNQGEEFDDYKPIVDIYPQAASFIRNEKVHYIGWYRATIFAHDASGIKKTILFQRVKGESVWNRVDEDNNLSNTIGGTFGGSYSVAFDYSSYPKGTILQFKHITVDRAGLRTKIIKRVRVKANGSLKFIN
ncbi:hypothetical protein ACFL17_07925 [Pseudomonadota bacterium]